MDDFTMADVTQMVGELYVHNYRLANLVQQLKSDRALQQLEHGSESESTGLDDAGHVGD